MKTNVVYQINKCFWMTHDFSASCTCCHACSCGCIWVLLQYAFTFTLPMETNIQCCTHKDTTYNSYLPKKKSQLMNYNNDVCLCAAILFLQLSTKVWKLHLNPKHTCSNMFSQSQVLFSASHYLSDIKLRYMIMIKSFIYVALLEACLKCI